MKFKNPLLVVTDMERSVKFYRDVLGLRKTRCKCDSDRRAEPSDCGKLGSIYR